MCKSKGIFAAPKMGAPYPPGEGLVSVWEVWCGMSDGGGVFESWEIVEGERGWESKSVWYGDKKVELCYACEGV